MTPEVLQDQLAGNWPMEINCAKCESRLRVDLHDLEFGGWKVSGYHFDGSAVCEDKYTFKCPVCGTEANGNEVVEDDIPLEHRKRLREGAKRAGRT